MINFFNIAVAAPKSGEDAASNALKSATTEAKNASEKATENGRFRSNLFETSNSERKISLTHNGQCQKNILLYINYPD